MNPCPCGYLGHASGKCRCTPDQVARYRGKLSGPLLDRIDLLIEVPALPAEALQRASGRRIVGHRARPRRAGARRGRLARQGKPNARLTPDEIDSYCQPDAAGASLLKQAMAAARSLGPRLPSHAQGGAHHRRSRRQRRHPRAARCRSHPVPAPRRVTETAPPRRAASPFCWRRFRRSGPSRSTPICRPSTKSPKDCSATPLEVQQTLSAYLLSFAFMTLWHGAISDRFGRRRVILVALALFGARLGRLRLRHAHRATVVLARHAGHYRRCRHRHQPRHRPRPVRRRRRRSA